jgi:hypothetical protein
LVLGFAALTEASVGHLGKARALSRQAVESALRAGNAESAATLEVERALIEAQFGTVDAARERAAAALALAPDNRQVKSRAALAYALAGDTVRAQSLTLELAKRFPQATLIRSYWLPAIQAQVDINKDPTHSIEILQATAPYDLSSLRGPTCMYPTYVRGHAYLAARHGREAAAEFQKILDHRGLVPMCSTGALARLGLARAYALASRSAQGADAEQQLSKARAAYQDFLARWKDADTDIPILLAARTEAAQLH